MSPTVMVSEVFDSVQGEGRDTGRWATFVRLAGCNLRCKWCDTSYAWEDGLQTPVSDVTARCGQLVVITGGEPLQQNLAPLLACFEHWREITIETNGTMLPPVLQRPVLWSVSPKFGSAGHTPDLAILKQFNQQPDVQWKLVFSNEEDWVQAKSLAWAIGSHHPYYLQPNGADVVNLTRWAWEHMPEWSGFQVRLAPQLHVLIWGQERCR